MECLITRNTHVQYESPTSSGLKVMAKVKQKPQGALIAQRSTMSTSVIS